MAAVLPVAQRSSRLDMAHEQCHVVCGVLQVVYDCGPVKGHSWEDFDVLRDRVAQQWADLPPTADNYSASLKAKVETLRQDMHGLMAARVEAAASKAASVAAAAAAAPTAAKA